MSLVLSTDYKAGALFPKQMLRPKGMRTLVTPLNETTSESNGHGQPSSAQSGIEIEPQVFPVAAKRSKIEVKTKSVKVAASFVDGMMADVDGLS